MNTPTEILDRIKKLLRLGKDSAASQAEAELALQRAFELASKHQIDIETISLDDDARRVTSSEQPSGKRLSFARKKILNILIAFFNVNVVINRVARYSSLKPSITFIGKPIDIQIALYVYYYLNTCCAKSLRDFCASKQRRPAASTQQSFVQGFIYGVANKLRAAKAELTEHQNALILSERGRRDEFEKSLFDPSSLKPVKTELSRANQAASLAGFAQGQNVEIRKPIQTNAAGQFLLA